MLNYQKKMSNRKEFVKTVKKKKFNQSIKKSDIACESYAKVPKKNYSLDLNEEQ